MEIKRFHPDYAAEAASLICASIRKSHVGFYSPSQIDNLCSEYSANIITKKSFDRDSFVLVENEKILGFGSIKLNQLKGIYIHPDYFGKGCGHKILQHLESIAKQRSVHSLQLYASLNAQSFYQKSGYKVVKDHFDDNGPAIVMSKDLNRNV